MAFTNKLIIFLCFCIVYAQALQFLVSREKCLSEDLGIDVLLIGTYTAQYPLSVKVINPFERVIWSESNQKSASFAFTTESVGAYTICFTPDDRNAIEQLVTFDLKMGVDAKDYDAIALKEHLTPLELELRKLEDAVTAINKHMTYMKQRESAMRDTNESTNSRVMWLSFFSLTVLVILGVGQIFYLKKYFESKKLI